MSVRTVCVDTALDTGTACVANYNKDSLAEWSKAPEDCLLPYMGAWPLSAVGSIAAPSKRVACSRHGTPSRFALWQEVGRLIAQR